MPRKGHVKARVTPVDSLYSNASIAKFINCLMLDGKKSTAERIIYGGAGYRFPASEHGPRGGL